MSSDNGNGLKATIPSLWIWRGIIGLAVLSCGYIFSDQVTRFNQHLDYAKQAEKDYNVRTASIETKAAADEARIRSLEERLDRIEDKQDRTLDLLEKLLTEQKRIK